MHMKSRRSIILVQSESVMRRRSHDDIFFNVANNLYKFMSIYISHLQLNRKIRESYHKFPFYYCEINMNYLLLDIITNLLGTLNPHNNL